MNDTTVYFGSAPYGIAINLNSFTVVEYEAPVQYSYSIQTHFGYLVSENNRLSLLDDSFQNISSYSLDGVIRSIYPAPSGSYFITTDLKAYLLAGDSTLLYLPLDIQDTRFVFKSNTYYWLIDRGGYVIQKDTMLNALDTIYVASGIDLLGGVAHGDTLLFFGEHSKDLSINVILFRMQENFVDFTLPHDIGITNIDIPDTVLAEYYNSNVPYAGWSYHIPQLDVTIKNFGVDTVDHFFVEAYNLLYCFWWCSYPRPIWEIDSIMIPPGESARIRLDSFVTLCDGPQAEVCLTTISPQLKADSYYFNDKCIFR